MKCATQAILLRFLTTTGIIRIGRVMGFAVGGSQPIASLIITAIRRIT